MLKNLLLFLFLNLLSAASFSADVLMSQQEFIERAFEGEQEPERKAFWLNKELKAQIKKDIDYQFHQLRVRYWGLGQRTAWILEEIGKEQPITMGFVVEGEEIVDFEVLVYRESRGDEIKHEFYRKQFPGSKLREHRKGLRLTQDIDGITGATLSVRASKKVATLALFLHQQTPYYSNGEAP